MDATDVRILTALQRDCDQSLETLGDAIGLSRNAVWRRVRAMQDNGTIRGRVVLADPSKLNLTLSVFIQVRAGRHDPNWLNTFKSAIRDIAHITGAYRMTGDLDYMITARVRDMAGYDALYQDLITRVPLDDVSASFVMEELKHSTELPLTNI